MALPLILVSAVLSACGGNSDTTKPTVTLGSIASPVTQAGTVTFSATATDDNAVKQVDFYVDDQLVKSVTTVTNAAYQTPYTWTISQNGKHTVKAVAIDTSNNQSEPATATVTVDIPDQPPVVKLISGPTSVTSTAPVTFSFDVSDDVEVTGVEFYDNEELVGNTESPSPVNLTRSYTAADNGPHIIQVIAYDSKGQSTTLETTVNVNIQSTVTTPDTTPPVVTLTVPTAPITTAGTYPVTVKATDNVGVTKLWGALTLPNGLKLDIPFKVEGGTENIPVTSAYNGTSTLVVYAEDAAGNKGQASASVTVAIP